MTNELGWYDSIWLKAYFSALDVIGRVAPDRLKEFKSAFEPLHTDPSFDVQSIRQMFDASTLQSLRDRIHDIPRESLELHELKRFGRFVVHDHPLVTELQQGLLDRISEMAGEPVEPSYNFLSLYTKRGVCERHLDSPSAKWTLDICLDQSEPWPIQFSQILPWPDPMEFAGGADAASTASSDHLEYKSVSMEPGDAIFFSGSSQWHYRDPMPNSSGRAFCDLLFLHYVPRGTSRLVRAENWAEIFGIPELSSIPGIENAR